MTSTVTLLPDEDSVESLRQWLNDETRLAGARVDPVGAPAAPDTMNWSPQAVQVIGDVGLLTAVATTVGAWLGTRARPTQIRVKTRDAEVEVEAGRFRDAAAITAKILAELGEQPPPGKATGANS